MSVSVRNLKSVPWFIYVEPATFISTRTVPDSVSDSKEINWSDTQIPGGRTAIMKFGSFGRRTVSTSIRIVDINDDIGVTSILAAFEQLRGPKSLFTPAAFAKPFTPPPQVIYYHTGAFTAPQWFNVTKCDYVTSLPNRVGKAQVADISLEMVMDETTTLYTAESVAIKALAALGSVKSLTRTFGDKNPYKKGSFF